VIAVCAGYYHTLALRADHSVVAWGRTGTVPDSVTNIVGLAAGWQHSLVLRNDGTVLAWGDNSYGQLNVPASVTNAVSVAAGYGWSAAILADGNVVAWGRNTSGQTNVPAGLRYVASTAAGEDYALALVGTGVPQFGHALQPITAYVNGQALFNADVQGTPPILCQWLHDGLPIAGATNRSLLLTGLQVEDAGLYTLVAIGVGQTNSQSAALAVDKAPFVAAFAVQKTVPLGTVLELSATALGTAPLGYRWQFNQQDMVDGSRIIGANTPSLKVAEIGFGDAGNYGLALTNAFGSNTALVAQIQVTPFLAWGDPDQLNVPALTTNVVAIAANHANNLGLRADGNVIAWGDNSYGQTNVPPGLTNVVAVAAGSYHGLALQKGGTVVAWGAGTTNNGLSFNYGQSMVPAGLSNVVAVSAGVGHSLALTADGTVVAWGFILLGAVTPPTNLANVEAISAGAAHSLALKADGTVVAWGENLSGQTNVPAGLTNLVAIAAGGYHNLGLRADGTVVGFGWNGFGQTNVPPGATNVVAIAAGLYHSLALKNDGSVLAWGWNLSGDTAVPSSLPHVVGIAAGSYHSLALLNDGAPVIVRQPVAQTVHSGVSVSFGVMALGAPPLSYQWWANGTNAMGNQAALSLSSAQLTDAACYTVEVSNAYGSVMSSKAILTVLRSIPQFNTSSSEMLFSNGTFALRLDGLSGHGAIVIETSTNLVDWHPLLTNPPVLGTWQFFDSAVSNGPLRFYRAAEQ
jgi:alpha-tubulin suppressor-like RCC1 family protein